MRIAMISDCYAPHVGGIETVVENIARELAASGHRVDVITATPDKKQGNGDTVTARQQRFGEGCVVVHRLALPLPGFLPINPLATPHMRQIVARCDVAHIHMGVVSPFAQQALALCQKEGFPTVVTWHCMLNGWVPVLKRMSLYHTQSSIVHHTAVSHALAQQVKAVTGVSEVGVIPNGVSVNTWQHIASCRPRPLQPHRPRVFVSAMRFMPRKRPHALVHMLHSLHRELGKDTPTLTVYGEGPQRRMIEAAARIGGVGKYLLLPGKKTPAELQLAYLNADAFFLPSTLESFGVAALEARSSGLPVFARSGTGMEDFLLPGVDAVLAPSDKELTREIARVCRSDRDMRILMEGAQQPLGMSWSASAKATQRAYGHVI